MKKFFPRLLCLASSLFLVMTACEQTTPTVASLPSITLTATLANIPQPTDTVISIPTLGVGSAIVSEKDGATLVYVPEGNFTMGSEDGESNEKPVHTVYLDAFWIDQTEVTNKQYQACVSAGACEPPSSSTSYLQEANCYGESCVYPFDYYGDPTFDNYPVIFVSWNQANAYCGWVERQLPTEAQWEKAARGPDGNIYPWGNFEPRGDLLNYNSIIGDTTKVGSYQSGKSLYGAFDMAGNVWEWVNDWYSESYYQNSPSSNPLGPETGDGKVLRGRSLGSYGGYSVRSSYRYWRYPSDATQGDVGFRCALLQ